MKVFTTEPRFMYAQLRTFAILLVILISVITTFGDSTVSILTDFAGYSPGFPVSVPTATPVPIAGSLDSTYKAGINNAAFGSGAIQALAIQPDGKHIVVGGFTVANSTGRQMIARLHPDGSIDETFYAGPGFDRDQIYAVAVQPDGKILVAGGLMGTYTASTAGNAFALSRSGIVRLNSDGSWDTQFNSGPGATFVRAMELQPDGKILIGGSFASVNGVARTNVARLNTDGTLDETFLVGTGLGGQVNDIALQTDGKIIFGGYFGTYNGTPVNGVFRTESNGTNDPTLNTITGDQMNVLAVAVQPDGKILVGGGFTILNGQPANYIFRLNANGTRDTFLEGSGPCPGTTCNLGFVTQITVLSDGKILVSTSAFYHQLLLFYPNGSRDTSFGVAPVPHAYPFDPYWQVGPPRHAVQADGSVLTTPGLFLLPRNRGGEPYKSVRRVLPTSAEDLSYNPTFGQVFQNGGGGWVSEVALQADRKLLVGGNFNMAGREYRFDLARFNVDGSTDTTFNWVQPWSSDPDINAIIPLSDGKILIGGFFSYTTPALTHFARLNADGSRDMTFVGSGASYGVRAAALQSDGKIIVAGEFVTYNGVNRARIARLHPDGSVDTSFDSENGATGSIYDVAIQPDGKIIAIGDFTAYNSVPRPGIVRILPNGLIDPAFDYPAGQLYPAFNSIALLPSGKILAGGTELIRLNSNGTRDNTFSGIPLVGGNITEIRVLSTGKIMIAGGFYTYSGPHRRGLARANPDGGFDLSFGSGLRGAESTGYSISGLAIDEANDHAYYGGSFHAYNLEGRGALARVFLNGVGVPVTVDTNPSGRSFTVDGTTYTSPQAFQWANGSQHSISTTSPQVGAAGTQYVWANWTDGGAISHTVTANAAATYTANFTTQHQLTMNAGTGGTVSPVSAFYNAGQVVPITATPNVGFSFANWAGTGSGSYTGANNPASVTMNGPISETAAFVQSNFMVSVGTNLAGRSFTVDGTTYSTPQTFTWQSGSTHTIATTSPQAGTAGTQYVWANWSDGGAVSHTVTANAAATYTANFTTQHQLTMNAGSGGTVSPVSAFYNSGQVVPITATPNAGFTFGSWTGSGTGSYSGTNNPASVTMSGPVTQTASFNVVCTYGLSSSSQQMAAAGGSGSFGITAPAGCAWTATSNAAWLTTTSAGTGNGTINFAVAANTGTLRSGTITVGGQTFTVNQNAASAMKPPADFDGDRKTDLSIFRPNGTSGSEWWWLKSSTGGNAALQFGSATDKIAPVDFTGDGKTDVAFWRPSTGQWFVMRSEDFSYYAFEFGSVGDVPVPADYDGDGKADAAVFRESQLTWYISKSSGGTDIVGFGAAGDKPVNADYDGDGKADIAIYRPNGANGAEWWIRRSSNGLVFATQFGQATDKAVQGDYTGDGKADIAFWTPASGSWYVLRSEDFSYYAFEFGSNGDLPSPGDYDGDGKLDAAVFRPSSSTWYANRSTAGVLIQQFGIAGDVPVPGAFVR